MKKITRAQYLQLCGIVGMAHKHYEALDELFSAAEAITGKSDNGHTSDMIFGSRELNDGLRLMGIELEDGDAIGLTRPVKVVNAFRPGDVVFLETDRQMSAQEMQHIREQLRKFEEKVPGLTLVVLEGGLKVASAESPEFVPPVPPA